MYIYIYMYNICNIYMYNICIIYVIYICIYNIYIYIYMYTKIKKPKRDVLE